MNKLIIIIIVSALGLASIRFFGDDNKLEELTEEVIKQNTGIEVDLSPNSLEK